MSMGGGNPQMQELAQQIEEIEQQQEALEEEIERLQSEKQDINEAIDAIGALESGSTVQVPVGGDAYVRAEIQDIDEVVVSLGGGYAAERDQDGAVETLETKQDTLDDRIEELRSDISELETEGEKLEQRAQQMQQQQLQQMQQQQQQQQQDDE
jgi:prefoldin alpha subunit